MNNIQEYLDSWHMEDERVMGAPPICQYLTTISPFLTWKDFVETGTLKHLEKNLKLQAQGIVEKDLPKWFKATYRIEIITRASMNDARDSGIVSTSAYFEVIVNE
jgi:hypothetical protein